MNRQAVAQELLQAAREIESAERMREAFVTAKEMARYCPECAKLIRTGAMRVSRKDFEKVVTRHVALNKGKKAQWESLPSGWTRESLESFWGSLVGEVEHKVTKCIDKMSGTGIDDPGAFCASLADKMEPGWRSER